MKFGTLPYRATTYYGQVDAIQTSETGVLAELVTLLEELKKGERECVQKLVPFLTDESFDVRQYSQQLFAHVCCHTDVHAFRDCLEVAEDEFETARIAFRLGRHFHHPRSQFCAIWTTSPRAITLEVQSRPHCVCNLVKRCRSNLRISRTNAAHLCGPSTILFTTTTAVPRSLATFAENW